MGNVKRDIKDISCARHDLSPFLVHLTKNTELTAGKNLESILKSRKLNTGDFHGLSVDTIAFGTIKYPTKRRLKFEEIPKDDPRRQNWNCEEHSLRCVSMTETPLDQIHCLLDIKGRGTDLQPYRIVLLKEKIQQLDGVCPVWYVNNYNGSLFIKKLVETMWRASYFLQPDDSKSDPHTNGDYDGAILRKALCFIENCGDRIGCTDGPIDFYWEREWRSLNAIDLCWNNNNDPNAFIGLCPDEEISHFESISNGLPFIDPRRSPSYYASKILGQKKALTIFHNLL